VPQRTEHERTVFYIGNYLAIGDTEDERGRPADAGALPISGDGWVTPTPWLLVEMPWGGEDKSRDEGATSDGPFPPRRS
jgi:hypothetical protein